MATALRTPLLQNSLLDRIRTIVHKAGNVPPPELLCPVIEMLNQHEEPGSLLRKSFAYLAAYDVLVKKRLRMSMKGRWGHIGSGTERWKTKKLVESVRQRQMDGE